MMSEDKTTTTPVVDETNTVTDQPAAPVAAAPKRKKVKRSVPFGHVHISATFNNTIITVTDPQGGALTFSSAGACGFRGSKKGTAYAAQIAAEKALGEAKQNHAMAKADIYIKGIGLGREAAIRAMQTAGIMLDAIHDVTGVPHGGVRPKKSRRV